MRFNTIYGVAKECSTELRPSIKTVEETIKSVVGPVKDKFHLVPDEILRHTDTDQDHHCAGHRTPVANITTLSEMAVRIYTKCEPVAEQNVASACMEEGETVSGVPSGGECGCVEGRDLHGEVQQCGYQCRGEEL